MKKAGLFAALLAVAIFGLTACGGKSEHEDHDHAAQSQESGAAAGEHDHAASDAAELAKAGFVNTKCPIMGDPIDPAVFTDHMGKKVGFCCKDCIPKWNKLSDAEKMKKLGQ